MLRQRKVQQIQRLNRKQQLSRQLQAKVQRQARPLRLPLLTAQPQSLLLAMVQRAARQRSLLLVQATQLAAVRQQPRPAAVAPNVECAPCC